MSDKDLAALLHEQTCGGRREHWQFCVRYHEEEAARLLAQGVRVGDDGLRAALKSSWPCSNCCDGHEMLRRALAESSDA